MLPIVPHGRPDVSDVQGLQTAQNQPGTLNCDILGGESSLVSKSKTKVACKGRGKGMTNRPNEELAMGEEAGIIPLFSKVGSDDGERGWGGERWKDKLQKGQQN